MKNSLISRATSAMLMACAALAVSALTCKADDPNGLFVKPIPAKTVVLTFDDSCLSHYTNVAPILTNYGFGGSFYISEFDSFNTRKDWYMTWGQISNLNVMGLEVGNHTVGHGSLAQMGLGADRTQVLGLENDLIANGTPKPTTLAYPFYDYYVPLYEFLYAKGYPFVRGGGSHAYQPAVDSPFNVPSYSPTDTNTFISNLSQATAGQVVVFTFHGVPDLEHPGVTTDPAAFAVMMKYLKDNGYHVLSMRDLGKYVGRINASLTNTPVTGCTSTSAVLHAAFRCAGLTNTVYAYWNTTNGGTNAALWANSACVGTWTNVGNLKFAFARGTNAAYTGIFTNMAVTNLSCTVTGLAQDTSYYYTFCVSNEWGRVWAPNVLSFRLGAPLVDNNAGATSVALGVTQFRGLLSNGVADVYLYWGNADGGTSPGSWGSENLLTSVNPGAFAGTINVSTQLYGVTYYYRCYASNGFGTAWAPASISFTTMKPVAPPPTPGNPGFETPVLTAGTRTTRPSGASWTFTGECGVDANDGFWYTEYAPEGNQAAFIQGSSQVVSLSQSINFARAGKYTASFNALVSGEMHVQIDGTDVLVLPRIFYLPLSWGSYTTPVFAVSAGAHTLSFVNPADGGGDAIDNLQISGAGVLITLTNTAVTSYAGPSASSAVLNATLSATSSVYNVFAYWSTVNCGTNADLWGNSAYVGSYTNAALTNISYALTGLATNTQYFYTFRASNPLDEIWAPNVLSFGPSAANDLLSFAFPNFANSAGIFTNTAMIAGTNVAVAVPYSMALTSLAPTYTVSANASGSPASGTLRDFTTPQTYIITSQNGTAKAYLVTVTRNPVSTNKDILTFAFPSSTNAFVTIAGTSITGTLHGAASQYAAAVTNLAPTYTVSPLATGAPGSGASRNFSTPQSYTVTAEDGSTKVYSVTVTVSDAPVANAQSDTVVRNTAAGILLTGGDSYGYALTYTTLTSPGHGTLAGTPPNLTYTSTGSYTGADSFTFKVNNGLKDSAPATVSLNILPYVPTVFYWTNAVSDNWSGALNWTNGAGTAPNGSGSSFYSLNFNKAGTYTATHDLNNGFQVNQLTFGGPTLTVAGNSLAFTNSNDALPKVNQNSSSAVTLSTPLNLAANTTFGGTGAGQVTLASLISGTGSLIKSGPSALTLGNVNNTYSGGTVVLGGTITPAGDGFVTAREYFGSGTVTMTNGATLLATDAAGQPIVLTNKLNLSGGTVTIALPFGGATDIQYNGPISGPGGLSINGGTRGLTLNATNTYTGGMAVASGNRVYCQNARALGSGPLNISGIVYLNYSGDQPVASLTLGGVAQVPGSYGSSTSGATYQNNTYFSGNGRVTVAPLAVLTNSPATSITTTSAVLKATLSCTGAVYSVVAYWNTVNGGTNPTLWTNSAYVGTWSNAASASLNYTATGLAASKGYYFAFRATNLYFNVWGTTVRTFTTLAPPPPPTPVLPVSGVTMTSGVPFISFTAAAGCKYRLNYKYTLADTVWLLGNWTTNLTGSPMPMVLTDSAAAGWPQRFYRIEGANP